MLYNINKDKIINMVFNNPDKSDKILAYMFNMANNNRMLDFVCINNLFQ